MNNPVWKLIKDPETNQVKTVWRRFEDGREESVFVTSEEYLKWLAEGNTPEPADQQGE